MQELTPPTPLSKYVRVDQSPLRLGRLWTRVSERLEASPRTSLVWWKPSLALLLVAAMTVGAWRLVGGKASPSVLHAAVLETLADGLTVKLDDGSRIELSARTRLSMLRDDPHDSSMRIERGRVICDLGRGFSGRFSVLARDIEVRVTGTRFGVELDQATGKVEVVVDRGSVQVLDAQGAEPSRVLRAGERWSSIRPPAPAASVSATSATEVPVVEAPATDPPMTEASATEASRRAAQSDAPARSGAALVASAVAAEPVTARSLFDQGNVARRAGDASAAAKAYQTLLTKFPGDSRAGLAAFELGRLRMGPLGDLPGAIAALRTAVGLLSGSAFREDAMARLVEAYAASGQGAPCRSAREAYLRDYPNGVHAALISRHC